MRSSTRRWWLGAVGFLGMLALAACGLVPPPQVVTLEITGKRNALTDASWVAVRDPGGSWQLTPSVYPGHYEIPTDGEQRFAVAFGCASDPPSVTVLHGTAGEVTTLAAKCEAEEEGGCGEATALAALTPQAYLFTVDAQGVAADEKAFVFFHGSPITLTNDSANVNVAMGRDDVLFFTAVGAEDPKVQGMPDPNGITAFHWTTASSTDPAVHVVASGSGSNVTAPIEGTALFTGAGNDKVNAKATLKLPHEVRVPLGTAASAQLAYHGVPDGLASLVHESGTILSGTAFGPATDPDGQTVRSAQLNLASTAAQPSVSVDLPATNLQPVEHLPNGSTRWTAYQDAVAGRAQAYSLTTTVGPADAPTLVWTAVVTPRWLSIDPETRASGTLEYRLPDLSRVAGIDGSWLIDSSAGATWEVAALSGTAADGSAMDMTSLMKGHGVEEPGSMLLRAGRRGSF